MRLGVRLVSAVSAPAKSAPTIKDASAPPSASHGTTLMLNPGSCGARVAERPPSPQPPAAAGIPPEGSCAEPPVDREGRAVGARGTRPDRDQAPLRVQPGRRAGDGRDLHEIRLVEALALPGPERALP